MKLIENNKRIMGRGGGLAPGGAPPPPSPEDLRRGRWKGAAMGPVAEWRGEHGAVGQGAEATEAVPRVPLLLVSDVRTRDPVRFVNAQ